MFDRVKQFKQVYDLVKQSHEFERSDSATGNDNPGGGIPTTLYTTISETQSSVVQACLVWVMDTLLLSPIQVKTAEGTVLESNKVKDLLTQPSKGRTLTDLIQQMVSAMVFTGEVSLWYDGESLYVVKKAKYRSTSEGLSNIQVLNGQNYKRWLRVPNEEVLTVPYRVDKDGENYTPLTSVRYDITTDHIRAWRTGSLLQNEANPNMVVSPKVGQQFNKKDLKFMLDEWQQGAVEKRGAATGFNLPADIWFPPGTNLKTLDMRGVAWIVEERVCAVLRVAPDVAKLGVGLEQSNIGATMQESVLDSWRGSVRPLQRRLEVGLSNWLPELVGMSEDTRIEFDNSKLPVLQEEEERVLKMKSERLLAEVTTIVDGKPLRTVEEYREGMGYDV